MRNGQRTPPPSARGEIRTLTSHAGPAGLSRLRLPFRHPGAGAEVTALVGRGGEVDVDGRDRGTQPSSNRLGPGGVEPVRDDDPFDHVLRDRVRIPPAQLDRDDRTVPRPADGARGARPAGWAAERRHHEPDLPALGREEPGHRREPCRRYSVHDRSIARGCDTRSGRSDRRARTRRRARCGPARVRRMGSTWARRSPHDREIVRLALPAFGALIAEPLYLLADTAIVGHLGTHQLGGIAIAAIVLTATFGIFNFLAYTTTGTVARHVGAGDDRAAVEHGVDGLWLAVLLGVALTVVGQLAVPAITTAMGASGAVRPFATEYLRISLLGAPFVLIALAG